jgi:hypothetical protein
VELQPKVEESWRMAKEKEKGEMGGPVVPAQYQLGTVRATVLRPGTAPGPVALGGQSGTGPEVQPALPLTFPFFFFLQNGKRDNSS